MNDSWAENPNSAETALIGSLLRILSQIFKACSFVTDKYLRILDFQVNSTESIFFSERTLARNGRDTP